MTATGEAARLLRSAAGRASIGLLGLTALAVAYWFTYEPAPGIRVAWGDDVSLERQESVERKYLLSNRRGPHPENPRSLAYDLLDTRLSNVAAMVNDPAVVNTGDIDDEPREVRLGTPYGERWMWVAHRIPLLRYGWVRWTVIVMLAGLAISGLTGLRRRPRSARSPA